MKKIKKYLLTSLSLGIVGVTTGAIIASCANQASENTPTTNNPSTTPPSTDENSAPTTTEPSTNAPSVVQNDNPNPASTNSIITNPDDPLTQEQKAYQEKIKSEIQNAFAENNALNYQDNKDQIDQKISEYTKTLSQNPILKPWIEVIKTVPNTFDNNWTEEQVNKYVTVVSEQYDNFPQKNLLPTQLQINELKEHEMLNEVVIEKFSSSNWKVLTSGFINFHSDPKTIILLAQLLSKKTYDNETDERAEKNQWYSKLMYWSIEDARSSIDDLLPGTSSFIAVDEYYNEFFHDKCLLRFLNNYSLNNSADPMSLTALETEPGDPLTQSQIEYHQILVKEIQPIYEANKNLDYTKDEDKANIDGQIKQYQAEIAKQGPLNTLITNLSNLQGTQQEIQNSFTALAKSYYHQFPQKNLLPTAAEANAYLKSINSSSYNEADVDLYLGLAAIFYSDPKSIILLEQLQLKTKPDKNREFTMFGFSFNFLSGIRKSLENSLDKKESNPAYQAENYYNTFIQELNSLYNSK